MDKIKKYGLYIFLLILLAILSEFLIAVGLNSSYKQMENASNNDIAQVEIYQSESTKVNGRIRGIIKNDKQNPIEEKYLKFDLFSDKGTNMGSKYIEVDKSKEQQPFEAFFRLDNVSSFRTSFVSKKDPETEIEFIPKDLNKSEIIVATIITMLIFWG